MKGKAKKIGLSLLAAAMLCGTVNPISIKAAEKENGVQAQAYDTTKPVFEKLEFQMNEQTVKVGEKLPVYVYAYDADSGIKSVSSNINYTNRELDLYDSRFITYKYNEKEKRYEGEIEVIDGGYTSLQINNISITDNSGNILEKYLNDEGKDLYKADIEGGEYINPVLGEASKVNISKLHQTVSDKEELTFSVLVPDNVTEDITNISLIMSAEGHSYSVLLSQSDDNSRLFIGTNTFSYNGKYVLKEIIVYGGEDYHQLGILTYKNSEDIWMEVEKEDNVAPTLKSIEMTHKGEIVKPGDKIKIRIKAEDNVQLDQYANVVFQAAANDIETNYLTIFLNYDNEENIYEGELDITDKTYPCEWYISELILTDTSNNKIDSSTLDLDKEYYVMVKNGDKFVNPTYTVSAFFEALDDEGNNHQVKGINEVKVERRTKWRDVLKELPDGSTNYKGLKFQGWIDDKGKSFNLDDEILSDGYSWFQAMYDKKLLKVNYNYPNQNLTSVVYRDQKNYEEILVDNSTTYKEVYNLIKNKDKPKDIYNQAEFVGWKTDEAYSSDDLSDSSVPFVSSYECYAEFKNRVVIEREKDYFDEHGYGTVFRNQRIIEYDVLDKDTTYNALVKKYSAEVEKTKHYSDMRFKEWEIWCDSGNLNDVIKESGNRYARLVWVAEYENCMVSFILRNNNEDEYIKPLVAEIGEKIIVPKEIDGYKNIKWDLMSFGNIMYGGSGSAYLQGGDEYTVGDDVRFYGHSDSVVNPDKPIEKPIQPNKPETKPEVNNKLSQQVIQETINQINNAKNGETLEVSMGDATFVPKAILEALKGKNVTVNLNMNGYTWSINGKDIMSNNLQDINLAVKMNTNNIPSKIVDQLAQGDPVKQLSLEHNGDFGFKANLSFNIGEEFKGKYGNLYYYDSDGKMVYMNAGQIKDDGLVSLSFSHASEYAVVISDAITPNTGDSTNASSYIYLLIGTMGIGYVLWKKRKETFSLKSK